MSLPWIRFDTSLPDHPKVLALLEMKDGHRAAFVYCCALAYAGKHGTDGFIPREAISRINGRVADAERLVDVGLLDAIPGGWTVNGWAEKQESTEETQQRRARAQAAAAARWSKKKGDDGDPPASSSSGRPVRLA
jgi:hypothetical protein